MRRLTLIGSLLGALVLLTSPTIASSATTYHGTMSTAQHYCAAETVGPLYDVLGTWNLNVGTQGTEIAFNYKNPGTGVHTTWSLLHDWQADAGDPYHFVNQYGSIHFDVQFAPTSGSFQYTIALPSCVATGWDHVVITGAADRG